MAKFAPDLLFVGLLVVAWVAQQVLRRRMADKRSTSSTAADPQATQSPEVIPVPTPADNEVRHETPSRQPSPAAETPADAPAAEPEPGPAIRLDAESIRQAIIMSEVLGKPKSLR